MTLDQAILEIQELKKENHSFWTRIMLGRWTGLLNELKFLFLQPYEKEMLESELDIHVTHLKKEVTKQRAKKELKLFLRYLKDQHQIQSYDYMIGIGMILGMGIAVAAGFNQFWGIIGGFFLGQVMKSYASRDIRTISTNIYDFW